MIRIQRVLVPLDFSPHSHKAFDYAVALAETFGAQIHLLHCYRIDVFNISVYDPPYVTDLPADFDERVRSAAAEKLAEYAERARAAGLHVEEHLSPRVPADAIPRTAGEVGADLIVMGTRGLSGLKHVILGSVADRTIRLAPCPVLTVKAEE